MMRKDYLQYVFYYDLKGRRRLRLYARVGLVLIGLAAVLILSAAVLNIRNDRLARSPVPTPVLAEVAPPTATPRPTATPSPIACPSPATWRLKPLLVPEQNEEGVPPGPTIYGLEPKCAYLSVFRTYLSGYLRTRGYLHTEINEYLQAPEALHAPIDPNKIGEYRSRPAGVEVLRADGVPKTVDVTYGNFVDYREWWPASMYVAPNYCYRAATVVPVRETPAVVVCAFTRLVSGRAGRTVEQIDKWVVRSSYEFSSTPVAFLDYVFVDVEGNAYLVASEFIDRPVAQTVEQLTALGELHGTGVWLFTDGDLFELPEIADATDWRPLAARFGAPTDAYPLPEGWENAPPGDQVPELMEYLSQQREKWEKAGVNP